MAQPTGAMNLIYKVIRLSMQRPFSEFLIWNPFKANYDIGHEYSGIYIPYVQFFIAIL